MNISDPEFVATLFNCSSDIFIALDEDNNISFFNSVSEAFFEEQSANVLGLPFLEFRKKKGFKNEASLELLFQNAKFVDEVVFCFGIKKRLSWQIVRYSGSSKEKLAIVLIGKKEVSNNAQEHLKDIIDIVPGNVWWKSREGVYLGCNNNVAKSLGLMPEDLIGKTDYNLPWSDYADELMKNDKLVMNSGLPQETEEVATGKDGLEKTFFVIKTPLFDTDHSIVGTIGCSIDITDKKQLQTDLKIAKEIAEDAKQVQEELFKNASHDFNTPMASLLGCLDTLNNCLACEPTPEYLTMARDFADKATDTADELTKQFQANLVHIFNITSNNPVVQEKFSIKLLLDQIIRLHKASTVTNDVTMSAVLDKGLPHFYLGDYWRLYHILTNLIGNAVKFTREGSINIDVSMHKLPDKGGNCVLRLQIKDTGIGIASDKRHAIFEKFTRLTPSYRGLYSGQGLGLSVVKRYLDDLEGQIEVESEGVEDKGSTFRCFIPFVVALSQSEEGTVNHRVSMNDLHPIPYDEARKALTEETAVVERAEHAIDLEANVCHCLDPHILLVEDISLTGITYRMLLSRLGCHVTHLDNVTQALQAMCEYDYDLIFMDVNLSDGTGDNATRRFRDRCPEKKDTPVVALTAHGFRDERLKKAGMTEVHRKPLREQDAVAILKRYIPHLKTSIALDDLPISLNTFEEIMAAMPQNSFSLEKLAFKLKDENKALASMKEFVRTIQGYAEGIFKRNFEDNEPEEYKCAIYNISGLAADHCCERLLFLASVITDRMQTGRREDIPALHDAMFEEVDKIAKEGKRLSGEG